MQNKIFLELLLLGSVQNNIFASEAAMALPIKQGLSLKNICFKNILDTLQKEDSDPIKMNIYESVLTKKVPKKLVDQLEQYTIHTITQTAALLWVDHGDIDSPFALLKKHNPTLADLVITEKIPWTLSIQDLIDAGGGPILQNKKSRLSFLSVTSTEGLQNIPQVGLRYLYLNNNKLTTIDGDRFNNIFALQHLYLNSNTIITIDANTFNSLYTLQSLSLSWNQIKIIEAGAFNGLIALTRLFICNNQIDKIDTNTFNGLIALKNLYLNHNLLTVIEAGAFNGLPALESLDFEGNQIKTIKKGAFDGLAEKLRTKLNEQFNVK